MLMREFSKERSVFKDWREDSAITYRKMVNCDSGMWKLSKVIKDEMDVSLSFVFSLFLTQYHKVTEILGKHMAYLKDIYLQLQTNSGYPFITMVEIANFCVICKLVDDRMKLSNIDLLYHSTNHSTIGNVKNKAGLIRTEFFEILVRTAKFKFLETKQVETFAEAL